MKEVYERKYDEAKNYLIQMFQAEYTKLHSTYQKNKNNYEKVVKNEHKTVTMLL